MRLGKLDNDQLEKLVLSHFQSKRPEVLTSPQVGVDCATIDLGANLVVLSSDPITSATDHLGTLSVHINCNDAAAAGAEPVGLLVSLLAPPSTTEEDIACFARELANTAASVGVDVLGGHTEITDSVTRMITSTTVLAKLNPNARLTGMREGDDIVMTKWAGLEGTAVIASDFAYKLINLTEDALKQARELVQYLSVVPEGRYAAAHGATAMHDITEGGVLGAAWEMAYTAKIGIALFEERIPILPVTQDICRELALNPLRLLSSGSMLIACIDGPAMVQGLKEQGIQATLIGKATGVNLHTASGTCIVPPEADALYALFNR